MCTHIGVMLGDEAIIGYELVQKWQAQKVSDKQAALIERIGINPDSVKDKGMASLVLDAVLSRQREGKAPLEAFMPLKKKGIENPEALSLNEAIRVLVGEFPMTFGKKYKNVPMSKVPSSFWSWMKKQYEAGFMRDQEINHPAAFRYMKAVTK